MHKSKYGSFYTINNIFWDLNIYIHRKNMESGFPRSDDVFSMCCLYIIPLPLMIHHYIDTKIIGLLEVTTSW